MIRDGFEQEIFFFFCKRNSVGGRGRMDLSLALVATGLRFTAGSTAPVPILYCLVKVKFEAERGEEATECKKGAKEVI